MSVCKLSVYPKNGGKKYDKMTFSISKSKKQKAKGKLQNFKNVTLSEVGGKIPNS